MNTPNPNPSSPSSPSSAPNDPQAESQPDSEPQSESQPQPDAEASPGAGVKLGKEATGAVCGKCGRPIEEGSPRGVCALCLMSAVAKTEGPGAPEMPSPELDELLQAFPQFEDLEPLGTGGMGRVYKARHLHLDRTVALKLLPPAYAADPEWVERFTREARALARLNHPNIVQVHDFGEAKTGEGAEAKHFPYLVMEYVDGVNLRQALRSGTLTAKEALAIVPSLCAALQYAHDQRVLHRDIKPENILLDTQGRVKIADFGLAKLHGEGVPGVTLTATGAQLGTAAYMAPEQLEKPHDVDHRADIYSLGVVFYEMLTGELPLGRFLAPSEKAGTDPRLDTIVFRTLEKERDRRFQTATEMKSEVDHVAASAPPPMPDPRAGSAKNSGRKPVWPVVLVFALLFLPVLLLALVVGYVVTFRASSAASPVGVVMFGPMLMGLGFFAILVGLCTWLYGRLRRAGWSSLAAGLAMALAVATLPVGGCVVAVALPMWLKNARPGIQMGFGEYRHVVTGATEGSVGHLPASGAQLPGLELAGVSYYPANEGPWWRMDGRRLEEAPNVGRGSLIEVRPGQRGYVFAFRSENMPPGTTLVRCEVEDSTEWTWHGLENLGRDPDVARSGVLTVAAALPENARSADVRAGFGIGEWKTLMESGVGSGSTYVKHAGTEWKVAWSEPVESKNGEIVSSWNVSHNEQWELRVVAVRMDGTVVEADSRNRAGGQSSWRFAKMNLQQFNKVQLQVRPIRWIEYQRIHLAPVDGGASRPPSAIYLERTARNQGEETLDARWKVRANGPGWATVRFMGGRESALLERKGDGKYEVEIGARVALSRRSQWARLNFFVMPNTGGSDVEFEEPANERWLAETMDHAAADGWQEGRRAALLHVGGRALSVELSSTEPPRRTEWVGLLGKDVRTKLEGGMLTVALDFTRSPESTADLAGISVGMSDPAPGAAGVEAGGEQSRSWTWMTPTTLDEAGRAALEERLRAQYVGKAMTLQAGETFTLFRVPGSDGREAAGELTGTAIPLDKRP